MVRVCPSCGAKNRISPGRLQDQASCGKCHTPISPLDAPYVVRSEADFAELVGGASLPVLVDFWAAWCGPCKEVAPELEKLARSKAGSVVVAKVDTEAIPGLAVRFTISTIPTMILFKEGAVAKRVSGAMPAAAIMQEFGI